MRLKVRTEMHSEEPEVEADPDVEPELSHTEKPPESCRRDARFPGGFDRAPAYIPNAEVSRMKCVIPGCPRQAGLSRVADRTKWMCEEHWFRLSLATRRRWWRETSCTASGRRRASLRDTVIRELNGATGSFAGAR